MEKRTAIAMLGLLILCAGCGSKTTTEANADIPEITEGIENAVDDTEDNAEYKTVELIDWQKDGDIAVMFNFPVEIVDIAFVSPSGDILEKNSTDWSGNNGQLEWAEGDKEKGQTWSTYRIHDAEHGVWQIRYNLGQNGSINYSIIDEE